MGRTAQGCYDTDSGVSRVERVHSKEGRGYLFNGMEGREDKADTQKLVVIPHFPLWDPGDARMGSEHGGTEDHAAYFLQFPYQSRREPLPREAWIDGYKQAAPRIQRVVDVTVDNVKTWGPKANDIDCTQDIEGRLTKMKLLRRECKKHQALEKEIAPNTPFESNVPDGNGGFIPVKCIMGGQGMCQNLNCYSDDDDLNKGIAQMDERAKTCRASMGLLVAEEESNGPIDENAEVSARTGGRLEVALPPPDTKGSAMPVDFGLAIWTAAGAITTARRNFAAAVFPNARVGGERATSAGTSSSACPGSTSQLRRLRSPESLHEFLCPRGIEVM